jgi:hypothetical protein
VTFNLAHAGEYVICPLAANRDVGVDIEAERTDVDFVGLARQNFSAGETRKLEASSCPKKGAPVLQILDAERGLLEGGGIRAQREFDCSGYFRSS